MIVDLHTHTRRSFDAFTTPQELLQACIARGIGIIAITEHDAVCQLNTRPFVEAGIVVIPGCEFTCDTGAHIIGLFVEKPLPPGCTREHVFDHIIQCGGLIVIPHPFKGGSGYFKFYPVDEQIKRATFIELLNGGWDSSGHESEIRRIAAEHGLRMIASSDSHKLREVGLCATEMRLDEPSARADPRHALASVTQDQIGLLIDDALLQKHGRKARPFQRTGVYQTMLALVPRWLRRRIKVVKYRLSRQPELRPASYRQVH